MRLLFDAADVTPLNMLAANMREAHSPCDELGDVASASLLEYWIDEAERRSFCSIPAAAASPAAAPRPSAGHCNDEAERRRNVTPPRYPIGRRDPGYIARPSGLNASPA